MYAIGWGPMLAIGLDLRRGRQHPAVGLTRRGPGDGAERRGADARRARDRGRHRADAGRPTARARARGARRARRDVHDQAVRARDDRDRTGRSRAAPERAAVPRARATRVRHHHGARRRRHDPLREPGVRGDPRLLGRRVGRHARGSSSRTPTTSTRFAPTIIERPRRRAPARAESAPAPPRRLVALVRGDRHQPVDDPSVEGWVANLRDITERKASEAALQRSAGGVPPRVRRRARSAWRSSTSTGASSARTGRWPSCSAATQDELVGLHDRRPHPPRRPRVSRRPPRASSNRNEIDFYRSRSATSGPTARRCGRRSASRSCATSTASRCSRSASSRTSPSARLLSDRLAYEAAHDAMTGLLNRVELHRARRRPRSPRRRASRKVAVLFIDLDHFKIVNDSLGHAAGDELVDHRRATPAQRAARPATSSPASAATSSCVLCDEPRRRRRPRRRSRAACSTPSPSRSSLGDRRGVRDREHRHRDRRTPATRGDAAAPRRRRDVPRQERRARPRGRVPARRPRRARSPRCGPAPTCTARSSATSSCCTTSRSSTCAPAA